ncbi:hypothetical protein [Cohnella cholangitidis]|uniref:Uncharacterized protein n=1 Tax=Cohnella cholangitidis TaxID=2598458 RepID=A0A7G5BWI4_9BACL|nr:hypothetical protein [Cohnella cholangitidis]QMV41318.1 hypothetical protein FPL14_09020 [Cohnella cholangitidis]
MKDIIPNFDIEIIGYQYLRRGCDKSGWSTGTDIFYRCANCGGFMRAAKDDFQCDCKAMTLDYGYGRFGSRYGDNNILVYKKF